MYLKNCNIFIFDLNAILKQLICLLYVIIEMSKNFTKTFLLFKGDTRSTEQRYTQLQTYTYTVVIFEIGCFRAQECILNYYVHSTLQYAKTSLKRAKKCSRTSPDETRNSDIYVVTIQKEPKLDILISYFLKS